MKDLIHRDRLGTQIHVNDFVVFTTRNLLNVGKVVKLTKKMIRILNLDRHNNEINRYSKDCVVVEASKVTFYILKQN